MKSDHAKTKKQLIDELDALRHRLSSLEADSCPTGITHEVHAFTSFLDAVESPASILDREFTYLAVNSAYERYFSKKKSKIVGRSPAEMIGQELFNEKIKPRLDRCLGGEHVYFEEWVDFPGMGRRWMHVSYSPWRNSRGEVCGVFHVSRDITGQQQAEVQADTILDTAFSGFWLVDDRGKLLRVNRAAADLLGYTEEELLACSVWQIAMVQRADVTRRIQRLKDAGGGKFESRLRRKDGAIIDVEVNSTYLDMNGGVFFAFLKDITEQKQGMAAIQAAGARLKEAQFIGGIGDWDWNPQTDVVTWSENLYHILGLDPGQPPPDYAGQLALYHPEDAARLRQAVSDALEKGLSYELELARTKPDGSIVRLLARGIPDKDEEGRILRLHGTVLDITERIIREEELLRATDMLECLWSLDKMGDASLERLCDHVLSESQRLSKSANAFLGFITPDQKAMELHAWSRETLASCSVADKYLVFPLDKAGIWAEPVLTGRVLICNDFASQDGRKGLPEGHVGIDRLLVVPIHVSGIPKAVIAVANKAAPYDDKDARQLEAFVSNAMIILERKRVEEALQESTTKVQKKLKAILHPEGDLDELELTDIIDHQAFQALMDDFFRLTGIGLAVLDMHGKVLVATGWQDICTQFHRVHPKTAEFCRESDLELSTGVCAGEFKLYRCKNNLWDISTPIMLGSKQIGNLFLGQFLFKDEEPDRDLFREQALRYGFDEAEYLAALDRLPRWSREKVDTVMRFYARFAALISTLGYANIKLAKTVAKRRRAEEALRRERARLAGILRGTNAGTWEWNVQTGEVVFNQRWAEIIGYDLEEISPVSVETWMKFCHPDDLKVSSALLERHFRGEVDYYECEARMRHKNGAWVWVLDRGRVDTWTNDGKPLRMMGTHQDITERKQAEFDLKEALLLQNEAITAGQVGLWDWNLVTDEVAYSKEWKKQIGYAPEEIGTGFDEWRDRLHPDDAPKTLEMVFSARSGKTTSFELEFRLQHKKGGCRWILARANVLKDNAGQPARMLGSHVDITERKEAEYLVRENQQRFEEMLNLVPDMISFHDPDFNIIYSNWKGFGAVPEEKRQKGEKCYRVYRGLDKVCHDCRAGHVLETKKAFSEEVELPEGLWVELRVIPLLNTEGEVSLLMEWVRDITERKQAEASLNSIKWLVDKEVGPIQVPKASDYGDLVQLNKSRVILNAVGSGILTDLVQDFMTILGTSSAVYEKNGDYAHGIFASGWCRKMDQASRRLCGCTSNAEALASGKWLCHESCWTEASQTAIETRQSVDIACKGGIRLYAVPIKSGNEIVGAINFGYGTPPRDRKVIAELATLYQVDPEELWTLSMEYEHRPDFIIDSAKQRLETTARLLGEMVARNMAEQHLEKAMHNANAANRSKSEFLANMSHEIRTPLNGVLGMLQLMKTTSLDKEQAEYTDMAMKSGRRLTRLLSDILDLSRIEAGKLAIQEDPLQLSETIRSVQQLFLPASRQTGVSFSCHVDSRIPNQLIGDNLRLQQILNNLVGNAFKFTTSGSIILEAYPMPVAHGRQARILFSVSDTGCGIPDHKLDLLFKPFTQVNEGFTRKFQGAGLGLAICKQLAGLMGGNISVDSEEGQGTTVHFCATFGLAEAIPPLHVTGSSGEKHAKGLRVLLAEDDPVSRLSAERQLEKVGCAVFSVDNGSDALDALRQGEYDVVFMDVQMPVMDGVAATRAIRAGEAGTGRRDIPVIALTAYAMSGDREQFLAAGMDGYIAKPVDMDELERVLAEIVARGQDKN